MTSTVPPSDVEPPKPCGDRSATAPRGARLIRRHLRTLPSMPGVYRMLDANGDALYVGKAKDLRKRVAAYAKPAGLTNRIARMVALTAGFEIITTHTEVEALLLESNLIKKLKPRYNVLLRDDKSFPYILITGGHPWPQITKHRGSRSIEGEYFGPFASAAAVNETLATLQRAFPLRSCSDGDFAGRTRPCLQYQIKRCAAPCDGRISAADYGAVVAEARRFLAGRSRDIQKRLSERMERASEALEFETAAVYRDRIRALTQIQVRQGINVRGIDEADVIAAHCQAGQACVQTFFLRAGRNNGNRAYFPANAKGHDEAQVLAAFIGQFYARRPPPRLVLVDRPLDHRNLIAEALSVRAGRRVVLVRPERGERRKLVEHAAANAREALARRLAESTTQRRLLEGLAEALALEGPPRRIEAYDNSHIQGAEPVGSMIVAGPEGLDKSAYRKFNMRGPEAAAGDDYAMMREMLTRRFERLIKEDPDRDRGRWPDLALIDGGKGQLGVARQVFADLGITGVALAAIAKGPDRDAGRERFFMPDRDPFTLDEHSPILYFLQRLRDEAHRFVIGAHRARRSRRMGQSPLDEVPGIGPRRKRALLNHFGSARAAAAAGLADLEAVEGIDKTVARAIYDHFHGGDRG